MPFLPLCALGATLALLFAAPSAYAVPTSVTFTPASSSGSFSSNIVIVADRAAVTNEDITVAQVGNGIVVRENGTTPITTTGPDCGVAANTVTCNAIPDGIQVDLGDGNDTFTAEAVAKPVQVAGGLGDDRLTGGSGPDVVSGGAGKDTLTGLAGLDEFFGGTEDDEIHSRDGVPERLACGNGNDQADNDFTDILAECERGTDADRDGISSAIDCNDGAAGIFPGAVDILENGVDEDCDGADDRNFDRDGDGFPVPGDCNDANAAIRPGALEIRGNAVDENCDRRASPFALLPSLVSNNWRLAPRYTQLRRLVVRNAPRGARIVARCKGGKRRGCKFERTRTITVGRNLAPVSLHPFFGRGKLRPGARITITITASGMIGRKYIYDIQRNALPAVQIICLAPGAEKGTPC